MMMSVAGGAGGTSQENLQQHPDENHSSASATTYTDVSGTLLDGALQIVPEPLGPSYQSVIDLLNNLYSSESRSFFRYMDTWKPYTTIQTIKLASMVKKMMQRSYDHADRLAHLVAALGGVTIPGTYSTFDGDSNYTTWNNVLPRLIATKKDMCKRHEIVLSRIANMQGESTIVAATEEPAVEQLQAMLSENQHDLAQLEEWAAKLKA